MSNIMYVLLMDIEKYTLWSVYPSSPSQNRQVKVIHKQLETHGCVINTVATDALVLKHQATSINSAD